MIFSALRSYNEILDLSTLRAVAENKLKVAEKLKSVIRYIENIVEKKAENADHQHFLLFPQCFQKLSFSVLFKSLPHNPEF